MLCAHLAFDGFKAGHPPKLQTAPFAFPNLAFEVEPKYHDPEYGLWRGFWAGHLSVTRNLAGPSSLAA